MFTRRAAMFSAAAAALLLATPLLADTLDLPRQKIDLVAPPFVHAHEQATKEGPRIMEFKLVIEEKESRHRRSGHHVSRHDVQRLDAGPADGGP
jgi:nitrite reductase (NO-forming)